LVGTPAVAGSSAISIAVQVTVVPPLRYIALSALDPVFAERLPTAAPPTYIGLPDAPFRVEISTVAARPSEDTAEATADTAEGLRILTIVY
jgi:hypothetical protein